MSLKRNASKCKHTNRRECARGLCGACYNKWLAETNPEFHRRRIVRFRMWKAANPEKYAAAQLRLKGRRKVYQRHSDLRKSYGIEPEEYDALLTQQDGVCAICGLPERAKGKNYLAVDHCHVTGRIRGLLCSNCNHGIGHLKDNRDLLLAAIKYLEVHNEHRKFESEQA